MSDQSSIAAGMISALAAVEPDLDTAVGTTVRNIIDVTAQQISEAYTVADIAQYSTAIDTLSGSALDAFVANFGFTRLAAMYATGVVTFTQAASTSSMVNITIPANTQVATATGVVFQTTSTYVIVPVVNSTSSVSVPVQAMVGGLSGNVAAGAITSLNTPVNGITSVSNAVATSGGTSAESDAALRARFKATIFRSYTGTSQSFLGAALDNSAVSNASVIGARTTHVEQISFSSGTATSIVPDAAYVYPYNVYLATDLSAATASVASGNVTLAAGVAAGATITSLTLSASPSVTLQAGATLNLGSFTAVVSSTTTVTTATSVPITSITPPSAVLISTTLTWVYNTGQFFAYGVDYTIAATTPVLANPGVVSVAQSAGSGFASGTTVNYQVAWATFSGMTAASTNVAYTTTASTNLTVTLPTVPAAFSSVTGAVYVFLYRCVGTYNSSTNPTQLIGIYPANQVTVVDSGSTPAFGTPPTVNTTGYQVTLTLTSGSRLANGTPYQVQFDYVPTSSRNTPASGVVNCVDLYTVGSSVQTAVQSQMFYSGPLQSASPILSYTATVPLATAISSGATVTSLVTTTPVNLYAGAQVYVAYSGGMQTFTVSANTINSTTIPVVSATALGAYSVNQVLYLNNWVFSGFPTSPLFVRNFQRPNGALPSVGNTLIPLSYSPVVSLPSTITTPSWGSGTNSYTYTLGSNYYQVNQTNASGMSNQSLAGIEWPAGQAFGAGITSSTTVGSAYPMNLAYSFNAVPLQVYNTIQSWRLLSHDLMVHQAYPVYLDFSFVVVFASNAVATNVQAQINTAIAALCTQVSLNGLLEASQVLAAVLNVQGVANARWAVSGDTSTYSTLGGHYAMQSVSVTDSTIETFVSTTLTNVVTDIQFTNITYPVFNATHIASVSQNAFATSYGFIEPL